MVLGHTIRYAYAIELGPFYGDTMMKFTLDADFKVGLMIR
jgi:hypothetical protein